MIRYEADRMPTTNPRSDSDVDHHARAPSRRRALDRELVKGHGLQIGPQRGALPVDDTADHLRLEREGIARAAHAHGDAGEDAAIAILEEDDLGHPVVQ